MAFLIPNRLSLATFFLLLFSVAGATRADQPDFNRDIRAVLADNCLACHGIDAAAREGDLRLDERETAIDAGAITPGKPDQCELIARIFSDDPDTIMPPPDSKKTLSAAQKDLLKRWIASGAEYQPHWAYTPLKRPAANQAHAIDQFIAARLSDEKLEPAPLADRITLIRRLSFDLTGLPPTTAEVDAFVKDASPNAYKRLVDRLLTSSRFGERMAIYWLDLVRYADTVGYHGDQNVSQSPYRDYVIQAFNDNMPYDQFVREQLAGDLLPDATLNQLVASGYNRLNQTTEEGGSQAKEYLAIYFADRVRNVSQVFLGSTMGCAQCHDHKYDPFTTRDFYSFGAFFADLEERGVYSARSRPPVIRVPSAEQKAQIAELDARLTDLGAKIKPLEQELLAGQSAWEETARGELDQSQEQEAVWIDDQQNTGGASSGAWNFVSADQGPVHSGTRSRRQTADGLVQHFFLNATKTTKVTANHKFFAWVYVDPENPPKAIMLQLNDGSWDHRTVWGSDDITYGRRPKDWAGYVRAGVLPTAGEWVRLEVDPARVGLKPGRVVQGMAFTQFGGTAYWDKAGWITSQGLPSEVVAALPLEPAERAPQQAKAIREYYLAHAEPMAKLNKQIADVEAARKRTEDAAPMTVVSKATTPRPIRILPRGNWLDDSGELVEPAFPAFLRNESPSDELKSDEAVRLTRLDLANWMCQPDNPLTSRTMVNRLWSLLFGRGLCASVDDFGGQGTFPSHPELLDWLAVEFIESGWDIKHIVRTIVFSKTYQRASKPSAEQRQRDPYNELLARQGRFRIDAEMVRDGALSVSGLLVEKVGGPSVKPYQPVGYYAQLNFPRRKYAADSGENQYRRGVYTHWQRTFLHPMLKAFDAPSREECTARRARSNTPVQALTLLNDPTFVEAARVFAARVLREGGESTEARIEWAYRTAVSREPAPAIAAELQRVFAAHLAHYRDHLDDAKQLISHGSAPDETDVDAAELAAWTSVARVILNLHETIMRY